METLLEHKEFQLANGASFRDKDVHPDISPASREPVKFAATGEREIV
jgi:hypothetical protein